MSDFTADMKRAAKLLTEAQQIMSRGPLDYFLVKLVEHSEALTTRFAPIKVGERAVIVKVIECKDGWSGCEKTLAVGQQGVIKEVDYRDGKFLLQFVPDKQWWRDEKGEYHDHSTNYSFCLTEHQLVKVAGT